MDTLYTIATRSEWRMSDLSRRLQVSAGSLTTMINRLIEAGVVERERCQQDRRVVIVKLNAAGEALVQAKRQEFLQNLQLLMADLSEADRAQLAEALGTVVDILNKIV
ncbi:MAG: MarR family transcriptional regulator [Firmicutes bacterium]|nr:MarR family transcriptional regulator [Bacillota bacterium]